MMITCHRCGLPMFDGPAGYAGPQCKCWATGPNMPPIFNPRPPTVFEGCQAYTNLTKSDIRRIVREELERMGIVKDKSHD